MAIRKPSPLPAFTNRLLTAGDYFAMPDTPERYELLEGRLVQMPAPRLDHQDVVGEMFVAFREVAREHGGRVVLSPVDVELSERTVFQPDLAYIAAGGSAVAGEHVVGAPDVVVEVASPSTRRYDREKKLPLYALHGVREAWIVDLRAHTVTVHFAADGRFTRHETVSFGERIPSAIVEVGDAGLGAFAAR